MIMDVDLNKLSDLIKQPLQPAAADELRRCNNVFFVGGELPVNEALETMFDSFCTEATELFHLSFGAMNTFHNSEEMARQIKKNFNVRLMGRLNHPASTQVLERIYAAGVDILDIPPMIFSSTAAGQRDYDRKAWHDALMSARSVFSRWSVVSTLLAGEESPDATINEIDALLVYGIVPLVALAESATDSAPGAIAAIFRHLASGWKKYDVPIKPFMPMISFLTPLTKVNPPGLFRGLIDKFHDRRNLVASDLRRHLRVKHDEDSMDSASL
jgi:hypothetical protein